LPKPQKVFLTHGEPHSADALANQLHQERGWDIHCPELGETVKLV
jgi:metallo-beta-lactamase family protein